TIADWQRSTTSYIASIEAPTYLKRARNRNLGLLQDSPEFSSSVFIFAPSPNKEDENMLADLVRRHPTVAFILYAACQEERAFSDNVYLLSECAPNIRIADANAEPPGNHIQEQTLLNAIGSANAVLSLS